MEIEGVPGGKDLPAGLLLSQSLKQIGFCGKTASGKLLSRLVREPEGHSVDANGGGHAVRQPDRSGPVKGPSKLHLPHERMA